MMVIRVALLILTAALVFATTHRLSSLIWVPLLAVAALPAWAPTHHPRFAPIGRLAEVCVTVVAASTLATAGLDLPDGSRASALLPYLIVPVLAPSLEGRLRESLILLGVAAGALTLVGVPHGLITDPAYLLSSLEWIVIAGLAAGFVHSIQARPPGADPGPAPFIEATRLLTQLRTLARSLPGATLDPAGIAAHLIEEVRAAVAVDRAAVLSGSTGGRLVVLAQDTSGQAVWEAALDSDPAVADAWASQQAQLSARRSPEGGKPVSFLIVPLVAGVRTVGLIALEADRPGAFPHAVVSRILTLAGPAGLRLEAALLFDDVRALATTEERQRLAREIHDGVAQEVVQLGYGLDHAIGLLADGDAATADSVLRAVREEVTRIVTELRLSLFELRSVVDRQGGLTAAVGEYARTVGSAGGLYVHFQAEESPGARLPAPVEAELMRIAQEAINNARRHARAQNLWVTCAVDPPFARIEIADDGAGIDPQRREGRLGLAIMRERAERIRGQLEITTRASGGTSVAVVVGSRPTPTAEMPS